MTALEVDEEEVKKGKGLLLTPNKRKLDFQCCWYK